MLPLKEHAPLVSEQGAIGLQIVLDSLTGLLVLLLEFNHLMEKFPKPRQSKVGSPPCREKTTTSPILSLDVLLECGFQNYRHR